MIEAYVPHIWNGVLLVGERPNKSDYKRKRPFMSSYGVELANLCNENGLLIRECATIYAHDTIPPLNDIKNAFVTKAVYNKDKENHICVEGVYITKTFYQSCGRLFHFIATKEPIMIITLGDAALFGTLGVKGIDAYRGSMLYWESEQKGLKIKLLPTHSPARLFAQYHLRYIMGHDIRRAVQYKDSDWPFKDYKFETGPNYQKLIDRLDWLLERAKEGAHLAVDIETRLHRFISCIGIAWSETEAVCVPIIKGGFTGDFWFSVDEELELVLRLRKILECKQVRVSGQNYHYDAQYLAFHWGINSTIWRDTLVMQHTIFAADMKKDLNTIASMYCESHVYWKDEGKNHEPLAEDEDSYWEYNCKDCCNTWEAAEVLDKAVESFGVAKANDFQHRMWPHLLRTMLRGVRYDNKNRYKQLKEVEVRMYNLACFIESIVPPSCAVRGKTTFYTSPAQLKNLFYKTLGQKVVTKRSTTTKQWVPSTDNEALKTIASREPLLKPLCEAIRAYRSLSVYKSTFLMPNPDPTDGRMRSGYKLSHPSTYRLASAGDVFDYGLNLQNLPKGNE